MQMYTENNRENSCNGIKLDRHLRTNSQVDHLFMLEMLILLHCHCEAE